jgi:glycosyltransferase involved in cell wall biosynthesis
MIRVLTVTGNYYPFSGGAENVARYIVEHTNDADFKNDVLTIAGVVVSPLIKSPSEYSLEIMHTPTAAYSIHRVIPFSLFGRVRDGRFFSYYTFAKLLIHLIRHSRNCDVIHAHTYHRAASAAVIAAMILNKPLIITGHNRISRLRDEIADGVMPSYLLKALKHCTRYVAISQEIARECESIAGMDASKVRLIYNGIDTVRFCPSTTKAQLRAELDLPVDRAIVICHGRLEKHKNQEMLINAFALSASKNALLLILGEGCERERLERLVADLGLTGRVRFLGFRKNTELYLQASDIYCLPSHLEGFSLALLEAMASGLICIATDIEGNNDAIKNGENGFLFNPDDTKKLVDLLDTALAEYNDPWATDMSQRAREDVVNHFSLQHMVEAYRNLYCEVLIR